MQSQDNEERRTEADERAAFYAMRESPIEYARIVFGLLPQRVKPEHKALLWECRETGDYSRMKLSMFDRFEKGKNLTWQQVEIMLAVRDALAGRKPRKIAILSGHGIGKSTTFAILILWFLTCYPYCKIPCTAPTQGQMYDVLWAEVSAWLNRMPEEMRAKFEWTNDYIRVVEAPETWFARARTARKEAPEALAGLHADDMMMLADEASGIPDEIFNSAKSALTSPNVLFLMISNGTRLIGYFYSAFHSLSESFQTLSFSSEESPVVDNRFVEEIAMEHGRESDEYRIRVLGQFPRADAVDDKGFVPLLAAHDLRKTDYDQVFGRLVLGVDPSGEGNDDTTFVLRDNMRAVLLGVEKKSTPKSIATRIVTYIVQYKLNPSDIVVDNFGAGANVGQELAMLGYRAACINVGQAPRDVGAERFLNLRAELFWEVREWIRKGGELAPDIKGWDELLAIRYRAELSGKLKIMGKEEMRKMGIKSPNIADALMLTFYRTTKAETRAVYRQPSFDPYNASPAARVQFDPY